MLEIIDLINQSSGRQREILLQLKHLNYLAFKFMKQRGKNWKQKYHELWKTGVWSEAKGLLREYFTLEGNGNLLCSVCKEGIKVKFTLHHEEKFYNSINLFTPLFVSLVHGRCHKH